MISSSDTYLRRHLHRFRLNHHADAGNLVHFLARIWQCGVDLDKPQTLLRERGKQCL
jgi:hypothetical protein